MLYTPISKYGFRAVLNTAQASGRKRDNVTNVMTIYKFKYFKSTYVKKNNLQLHTSVVMCKNKKGKTFYRIRCLAFRDRDQERWYRHPAIISYYFNVLNAESGRKTEWFVLLLHLTNTNGGIILVKHSIGRA